MRKILLALSTVLLLASFTNTNKTVLVLADIDGTLLQSEAVINQVNGEYVVTFTVDAATVVTSNTDAEGTHIYLVANGNSNSTATHTVTFNTKNIDFNNYFETNLDVASGESMLSSSFYTFKRPKGLIMD